jgi:uncharacterized protein (DUF2249 family)
MVTEIAAEPFQVDVRGLSLEDRRVAVAQVLDELRRGRKVVLVTDRDPRPILDTFRQMHRGGVDCTISALASDLFRTNIQIHSPEREFTIAGLLRADHARIDGLLTEVQHYMRVGAWAEADQHFATLEANLSRHMAAEEELLFPAMNTMIESVSQAVPSMLTEHGELRAILPGLAGALAQQNVLECETLLPQVRRSLARHHEDEERLVYPISDWALSTDEQSALARRLSGRT